MADTAANVVDLTTEGGSSSKPRNSPAKIAKDIKTMKDRIIKTDKLMKLFEVKDKELSSLKTELNLSGTQITAALNESTLLREGASLLHSQNKDLRRQLAEKEEELNQCRADKERLESKVAALESHKKQLDAKLEENKTTLDNMEKTRQEIDRLRRQKNEANDLKQQLGTAKEAISMLSEENEQLKAQLEEYAKLAEDNEQLKTQLEESASFVQENNQLKEEYARLAQENGELRTQIEESAMLNQENDELKAKEIDRLVEENDDLKDRMVEVELERDMLIKQHADEKNVSQSHVENQNLKTDLANVRAQMGDLQFEKQVLQNELTRLLTKLERQRLLLEAAEPSNIMNQSPPPPPLSPAATKRVTKKTASTPALVKPKGKPRKPPHSEEPAQPEAPTVSNAEKTDRVKVCPESLESKPPVKIKTSPEFVDLPQPVRRQSPILKPTTNESREALNIAKKRKASEEAEGTTKKMNTGVSPRIFNKNDKNDWFSVERLTDHEIEAEELVEYIEYVLQNPQLASKTIQACHKIVKRRPDFFHQRLEDVFRALNTPSFINPADNNFQEIDFEKSGRKYKMIEKEANMASFILHLVTVFGKDGVFMKYFEWARTKIVCNPEREMELTLVCRITRVLVVVNDQVAGESDSRILVMIYDLFREGSKLNYALNILENIARVNPRVVNQQKGLRTRNDLGHDRFGFPDLLEVIGAQLCRAKQNDEMVIKVYNSISRHLGWNRPEDVKTVQHIMDHLLKILHSEEFKKDLESKSQGRAQSQAAYLKLGIGLAAQYCPTGEIPKIIKESLLPLKNDVLRCELVAEIAAQICRAGILDTKEVQGTEELRQWMREEIHSQISPQNSAATWSMKRLCAKILLRLSFGSVARVSEVVEWFEKLSAEEKLKTDHGLAQELASIRAIAKC